MSDVLRDEPEGKRERPKGKAERGKVLKLVTAEPSRPDLWKQIAEEVSSEAPPEPETKAENKKSSAKAPLIIKPGRKDPPRSRPTTKRPETVRAAHTVEEVDDSSEDVELTAASRSGDRHLVDGIEADEIEGGEAGELDVADDETVDLADEDALPTKRLKKVRVFVSSHFATLAVGLVALILAVALVLSLVQLSNKNALESSRSSALSAAKTYAVEIAGYSYTNLNADFGKVLANSTPSFKHSYSTSSNELKSTLVKYKASATATVISAGIINATTSSASVLVALNQVVKNTLSKSSSTSRNQIDVNLSRVNGKWLINNVTIL